MTPEDRARHLLAEDHRAHAALIKKHADHEAVVRRMERERAYRRMLPLLNTDSRPSSDWDGCVE